MSKKGKHQPKVSAGHETVQEAKLNSRIKDFFSTLGRFVLSAGLLFYVCSTIDFEKTKEVVKSADLIYVFYAFLTFFFINALLIWRWVFYLRALGLKVSIGPVIRFFLIGLFGNLFLPSAIGGDVIKAVGLGRHIDAKSKIVASVLLDRLSGFAAMVITATIAFVFGFRLIRDFSLLFIILAIAAVSTFLAVILFNEKLYSFCCRIFTPFPQLKKRLMNVHYDIVLLKGHRYAIYQAVGVSCVAQIIFAGTFYFLAKALHQDVLLVYLLTFVPLICVASSFPSIGGLGVREAGTAYLFAKVGIASGVAVSISLMNFVFMVTVGLLGGLVFVLTKSPVPAAAIPKQAVAS